LYKLQYLSSQNIEIFLPVILNLAFAYSMTDNAANEGFSAAHKVLSTPLLLERIFTWIYEDVYGSWPVPERPQKPRDEDEEYNSSDYIERGGVLARCALVSKQWFYEATRILWRDWEDKIFLRPKFVETFTKMEPTRPQLYADMIHHAELAVVENPELFYTVQTTFTDITFSNLKSLYLYVPGDGSDRAEIPIFHAPQLTKLSFDPQYDWLPVSYSVQQDEWKVIFDLITVRCGYLFFILSSLATK
jgi:hypothetical protein